MCKCNKEMMDHLLLHCTIALNLWSMLLRLLGVYWVTLKSQGQFGNHRDGIIRKASPHCVMPCIWRETNA